MATLLLRCFVSQTTWLEQSTVTDNKRKRLHFVRQISCPGNSSLPSQQFSGSSLPNPVSMSWCSSGLVQFQTDSSITDVGFSLDYYVSTGGTSSISSF